MAQKIQVMKKKMDMLMSAMRGQVSTNLDELVHCTNSLFIALITSFPPLPNQVQDAIGESIRLVEEPPQPPEIVQNPYTPIRVPKRDHM